MRITFIKCIFVNCMTIMLLVISTGWSNQTLVDLPADTWYTVPNSKMRPACYASEYGDGIYCVSGCTAVIGSWSGGVYDPVRKQLVIWGGGHGDYCGNELYAFDIESLSWKRLTEPSKGVTTNQDPLPDGNPVSRHTYDGMAWIGHSGRIFARGGSRAGNGYGTEVTWTFDPVAKKWYNMTPGGSNGPTTSCCNLSCEYDPATRKVFMRDPNYLYSYDIDANVWTQLIDWPHGWGPGKSVVDTKRRLYFDIGSGSLTTFDIVSGKNISSQWQTSGGTEAIASNYAAAAYDSKTDNIVVWNGGGVWVLDPETKQWARKSSVGAPASGQETGTFGRFRYIPTDNVFILVNGVDENVCFYKHTTGGGSAVAANPKPERHRASVASSPWFIYDIRGRAIRVQDDNSKSALSRRSLARGVYLMVPVADRKPAVARIVVVR